MMYATVHAPHLEDNNTLPKGHWQNNNTSRQTTWPGGSWRDERLVAVRPSTKDVILAVLLTALNQL